MLRAFQAHGLDVTPDQWTVLCALWEAEGLHQQALADHTHKDRHTMTRILHVMEKKGLVRRMADKSDSRRQLIQLTDQGRALQDRLIPIAEAVMETALTGRTEEDLKRLRTMLRRVLVNLDRAAAQGGGAAS